MVKFGDYSTQLIWNLGSFPKRGLRIEQTIYSLKQVEIRIIVAAKNLSFNSQVNNEL